MQPRLKGLINHALLSFQTWGPENHHQTTWCSTVGKHVRTFSLPPLSPREAVELYFFPRAGEKNEQWIWRRARKWKFPYSLGGGKTRNRRNQRTHPRAGLVGTDFSVLFFFCEGTAGKWKEKEPSLSYGVEQNPRKRYPYNVLGVQRRGYAEQTLSDSTGSLLFSLKPILET